MRATARRIPDGSQRAHDKEGFRVSCDEKVSVSNQRNVSSLTSAEYFPKQGGTTDALLSVLDNVHFCVVIFLYFKRTRLLNTEKN